MNFETHNLIACDVSRMRMQMGDLHDISRSLSHDVWSPEPHQMDDVLKT